MAQVLDGALAVGKRGAAGRGLSGALLGAGLEIGGGAAGQGADQDLRVRGERGFMASSSSVPPQ